MYSITHIYIYIHIHKYRHGGLSKYGEYSMIYIYRYTYISVTNSIIFVYTIFLYAANLPFLFGPHIELVEPLNSSRFTTLILRYASPIFQYFSSIFLQDHPSFPIVHPPFGLRFCCWLDPRGCEWSVLRPNACPRCPLRGQLGLVLWNYGNKLQKWGHKYTHSCRDYIYTHIHISYVCIYIYICI